MVMIDPSNIGRALGAIGVKPCIGLSGRKCLRARRGGGKERRCSECHRGYMKLYRSKLSGKRSKVVDGYDFDQSGGI